MTNYTLEEFITQNQQDASARDYFQLESDRMLEVNLNGEVWTKTGSMVAYAGQIRFEREKMLERGLGNLLKSTVTGEGARLTKATGQGRLYLADEGKTIQILRLENQSIFVNGNDLLAFEPTLGWDIKMMRKMAAMMSGGLFNVLVQGTGLVAITSHFEPLALMVRPGQPVRTDPNATICWSGNLQPEFKTDVSLKTFFGRGSGESIQMEFNGDGFVVIQPYEEVYMQHTGSSS
ncbi:AIM24 family protein [Roseimaritima sediminicola]|uniref:AIM24 family protein n=1 Tax=Roseimaritima sediminicola TaxID=2662066 RepID=UPI001298354E|nr:AIM24 family protein [Roseimaritima sediminicola]